MKITKRDNGVSRREAVKIFLVQIVLWNSRIWRWNR